MVLILFFLSLFQGDEERGSLWWRDLSLLYAGDTVVCTVVCDTVSSCHYLLLMPRWHEALYFHERILFLQKKTWQKETKESLRIHVCLGWNRVKNKQNHIYFTF